MDRVNKDGGPQWLGTGLPVILLALLLTACATAPRNQDGNLPARGWVEFYSVGANEHPKASEQHKYLRTLFEAVNAAVQTEMMEARQAYFYTSRYGGLPDHHLGFRPHTIRIGVTIAASGKLEITNIAHPDDTPRRQLAYVRSLITEAGRHLSPFSPELAKATGASLDDTLVFHFN